MKNLRYKNILRLLVILLIISTLAFIFIQSMLPPEKSSEQSSAVGEIIEGIIPPETPVGGYVQTNIRKIAHFVEFAALGAEVAVFVILFLRRRNLVFLSFGFGILIALLDETIQVFSKRGPEITDVWLDFFGFASFAVIVYTVSALIFYIQVKRKQKF